MTMMYNKLLTVCFREENDMVHLNQNDKNTKILATDGMNLSANILGLMKKSSITESELAAALNIPYNTVKRLVTGVTTDPKLSTLQLIADYFKVGIDALLRNPDDTRGFGVKTSPVSVPILSWETLNNPDFLDSLDFNQWTDWQPVALSLEDNISSNSYAIKSTKSMALRFPLGTVFIVEPNEKPIDGDLILIRLKDSGEVALKDLIIDPPAWHLQPILPNSDNIRFNEDLHEVIGVVILTIFNSRS